MVLLRSLSVAPTLMILAPRPLFSGTTPLYSAELNSGLLSFTSITETRTLATKQG